MMNDMHLRVILPKNRKLPGWLRIEKNGMPIAEFRVLGRGLGNEPGDTSMSINGNTPTGSYSGSLEPTANLRQEQYGPWGRVRLKPVGGNALMAERLGRGGLLIHGGSLTRLGELKNTQGCLRLGNEDMRELMERIQAEGEIDLMSIQPTIKISVDEF